MESWAGILILWVAPVAIGLWVGLTILYVVIAAAVAKGIEKGQPWIRSAVTLALAERDSQRSTEPK